MGGAPRQRKHTDWPRKLRQGGFQRRDRYAILMVSSSGWIAVTAKSLLGC
jgi:hypothetical protein